MTYGQPIDPYDREVAERFAVLDRLVPPSAPADWPYEEADELAAAMVDIRPPKMPRPDDESAALWWRRPALVAAAAAALVVVVGVAVLTGRGGGSDDPSIEAGPASDDAASEADADADPDADASATAGDESGSTKADPSGSADGEPLTVDVDENDDASDPSSSSTDGTVTTTTTTTTTSSSSTASTTPATAGTSPTKATTIPERPTGSIVDTSKSGQLITVAGMVTEVFTDCSSWLVLNENGEAEHGGTVSCDGGSHIVVDGRRIRTSSGYVPAEFAFDRHPADLQPGQFAVVTAVNGPYGGLTLDCDRCGVGG